MKSSRVNDMLKAKRFQHMPQVGKLLGDSGSQELLQRAWEVTGRREESLAGSERKEGTCEGPDRLRKICHVKSLC